MPNTPLNDQKTHKNLVESPADTIGIAEAARRLGLTAKATRRAAVLGDIPAIRIGRRWLVLREPFEGLLRPAKSRTGGPM